MFASLIIALAAFPLYGLGFRWYGVAGLALASDAGIALQAVTLAILLHQRHMVSLASLDYVEMGRCLLASVTGGAAVWAVFSWLLGQIAHKLPASSRWMDLAVLVAGSALWLLIASCVLEKAGSALPRVMRKRLGLG